MSKWVALHIVMACLAALLALWMLRDYKSSWWTCVFRIAMSLLFGWMSVRGFVDGWEDGKLRTGCRGCTSGGSRYILIDQNPIEFVFVMGLYACVSVFALGCLLYHCWWLVTIVQARFR